jgi:hypothetical protein
LRLLGASQISAELRLAQRTLAWLHGSWPESMISLPDIYQFGPAAVRDSSTARRIVKILIDHGWLREVSGGGMVAGTKRREVWQIVRV